MFKLLAMSFFFFFLISFFIWFCFCCFNEITKIDNPWQLEFGLLLTILPFKNFQNSNLEKKMFLQ